MKRIQSMLFCRCAIAGILVVLAPMFARAQEDNDTAGSDRDVPQHLQGTAEEVPEWGGLTVKQSGAEIAEAKDIVVLMHGLGASADDLVPFGQILASDDETCFVFPDAPNKIQRGGRAWFTKPDDYQPSRDKVVALLKYMRQQNANARITLGGFSQGAMLASNFLEKDSERVTALILLSPAGQLRDDVTGKAAHKPLVFMAHGRHDQVLPFAGSDALQKRLVEFDYPVDWIPFDGGHTVPAEVVSGVTEFLKTVRDIKIDE